MSEPILDGRQSPQIGRNLAAYLEAVRGTERAFQLHWIDVIGISQVDIPERNAEVTRMEKFIEQFSKLWYDWGPRITVPSLRSTF